MAFDLPVPEGDVGATITAAGFLHKGITTPYHEIKKFRAASNDELEVIMHEKDDEGNEKVLTFPIDEGCARQLLDLHVFVETAVMQSGCAVHDEPARENIIGIRLPGTTEVLPLPVFDMKKIRGSYTSAYAFGK